MQKRKKQFLSRESGPKCEEILTIVQFSPQGGNGTVVRISELAEKEGFEFYTVVKMV